MSSYKDLIKYLYNEEIIKNNEIDKKNKSDEEPKDKKRNTKIEKKNKSDGDITNLEPIEKKEVKKNLKILCECGFEISKKNKNSHLSTKKHLNALNNKLGITEEKTEVQFIPIEKNKENENEKKIDEEIKNIVFGGANKKKKTFENKVTALVTPQDIKEDKQEKKQKKRQLKHSSFFVTINTNQRINKLSEEFIDFNEKFKLIMDKLFNNHMDDIIEFKLEDADPEKDIKNVNTEYAIEVGEKTGTIHSHSLISVSHYTLIQLNYEFIRDFIKTEMNLDNIYLNNRVVYGASSTMNLQEYITKTRNY